MTKTEYKYLHIYADSNSLALGNIRLLKTLEQDNDSCYVLCSKKEQLPDDLGNSNNVFLFVKRNEKEDIIYWLNKAEKVFFHFFRYSNRVVCQLLLHPRKQKKCVWIEWGGDLYEWTFVRKSLLTIIGNYFRRVLLKRFTKVVCILEPDVKFYHEQLGGKGRTMVIPYSTNEKILTENEIEYHKIQMEEKVILSKPVNILVGHRSTPNLNHIKVLDDLAKFSDKKIVIHLPLSYGDSEYAEKVIEHAYKLFNKDNVRVYKEFLPFEEYTQLMEQMDIACLYSERQIALGNIYILLKFGVKLYLKKDSVLFEHFRGLGMDVYDEESILVTDFKTFIQQPDIESYRGYLQSRDDDEQKRKDWLDVLKF